MLINAKIPNGLISDTSKVVLPQFIIMEEFEVFSSSSFTSSFNQVCNNPMPVVPLLVNSPGGFIYALMGCLSTMEASPKPVMTVCTSWAMSCGLIMLAAGTSGYRYMSEHATLMLHEASGELGGKTSEVKAELIELDRLNETVVDLLAKYSKKSKSFYQSLMKKNQNHDFYITAKEALDWGIIDVIGVPTISMELKADYKISVEPSFSNQPKSSKKK